MISFLNNILFLIGSFLSTDWLSFWFYPVFCLCFIASIPSIIRVLTQWR